MGRDLLVGVVGRGYGAEVHAPVLDTIPGIRLAGRPATRATVEGLLKEPLDAITLALPPLPNEQVAASALEHGIPILSEKPLAGSLQAADRLASLAQERTTAVGFQFAELETFKALKTISSDGELGSMREIDIRWLTRSRADRNHVWSWKTDATRKGGVLTLMGSHVLYLIEWLTGRILEVEAELDHSRTARYAPVGAEAAVDTATIRLATTHMKAVVKLSNAHPEASENIWRFVFEGGSAVLEEEDNRYLDGFRLTIRPDDGPERSVTEVRSEQDGRFPPFRALAERFVDAVRSDSHTKPDFATGARVQQLLVAVERAGEEGRVAVGDEWADAIPT